MLAAWGGSIIDTDHIRREKSVVCFLFEVLVGSTDSARKRGRGNSLLRKPLIDWPMEAPRSPGLIHDPIFEESITPSNHDQQLPVGEEPADQYYGQSYEEQYPGYYQQDEYDYQEDYEAYPGEYPPPAHSQLRIPPPEVQGNEPLSEKERARLAEERLLPSRPPQDLQELSSSRTIVMHATSSALPDELEEDLYSAEGTQPRCSSKVIHCAEPSSHPSYPSGPSAPTLDDLSTHHIAQSTDDKQELERQRMWSETSAPPNFSADDSENGGEGSSQGQHIPLAPSAPILDDDEYTEGYSYRDLPGSLDHLETLPKYEK